MELSVLNIECEPEQDDFVVIFKAFYEGYVIAHGGVLGFFEHWHVITKDDDFGHLGYHFDTKKGGFGNYNKYHFEDLYKNDTKFRVVKALRNVNRSKAEQDADLYTLLFNNCVHTGKSQ